VSRLRNALLLRLRKARAAAARLVQLSDAEYAIRVLYNRGQMRTAARLYPLLKAGGPAAPLLGARYATRLAELLVLIADAHFMLGDRERAWDAVQRAQRLYERVLERDPRHARAAKGLASIYFHREHYDRAQRLFEAMVEQGIADVEVLTYLGRLHAEKDDYARASDYLLEAIGRDPAHTQAHMIYGNLRPFLGDFKGKWETYDEADRRVPHHSGSRLWRGEPLAGKSIAIFPISGIGDEVRYACTYDRIIAMAQSCIVFCEPRLEALFRRTFPDAQVRPLFRKHTFNVNHAPLGRRAFEAPPSDYYTINLNAIQFLFDQPAQCATRRRLKVDPGLAQRWQSELRARAAGRRLIGVDWRSGLMLFKRRREYMDLEEWAPIVQSDAALFVSLSYSGDRELAAFRARHGADLLRPALDLRDDFDGLAALISSLDLVISAPTNIAEVAGFAGTPTWLVSTSPAHHYRWRILPDGSDIWFPNVRHFNAHHAGGRGANVRRIAERLGAELSAGWEGARSAADGVAPAARARSA
jgi:tetratricopeptide (TPR) repeat protein